MHRRTVYGAVDATFGSSRHWYAPGSAPTITTINDVCTYPHGSVVASCLTSGKPTLAKLTGTGQLDATFGISGYTSAADAATPYQTALTAGQDRPCWVQRQARRPRT